MYELSNTFWLPVKKKKTFLAAKKEVGVLDAVEFR